MSDILTEEQAKTKWCPFSRVEMILHSSDAKIGHRGVATVNRPIGDFTRCIASACMAWRQVYSDAASEPRGFCGAFCKPLGV